MAVEMRPENVKFIILHCTDTVADNLANIERCHRQRAFSYAGGTYIGYHYIIKNGFDFINQFKDGHRKTEDDGTTAVCRPECYEGCHALGYNHNSIGICMVGVNQFTPKQFDALTRLVKILMERYNIPVDHVLGHCETRLAGGKTCPNFDVAAFRSKLKE